jgi:hypothetical protein
MQKPPSLRDRFIIGSQSYFKFGDNWYWLFRIETESIYERRTKLRFGLDRFMYSKSFVFDQLPLP